MTDSAIAACKQALNIDTSFGETYRNIGDLFFAQGKFVEAIPYFEHLIKTRPSGYSGYDKLSFIYFKLNQFDKSIPILDHPLRFLFLMKNSVKSRGLIVDNATKGVLLSQG